MPLPPTFISFPLFTPSLKNPTFFPQFKPFPFLSLPHQTLKPQLQLRRPPAAIGPDGVFQPDPSDDDPPEAEEDSMHGVSRFQQVKRHADKARKIQEERTEKEQSIFLNAIADEEDAPDDPGFKDRDSGDDVFADIDKAIALSRKEFVEKGLLKPNPRKEKKVEEVDEGIDELEPEEVVDLEEIEELRGLTVIPADAGDDEEGEKLENEVSSDLSSDSSFDIDFDKIDKSHKFRIVDPTFYMTLAELLDESKVVPVSVYGNLEVEISGIQHDSRFVEAGDLFVCCVGRETDGHLCLTEAYKRGAVAVVASKEIDLEETLGCKAVVIVEDTSSVLPALAAAFFGYPSTKMSVIGITGTNGKTTTAYLIKGLYEAMGLRTGMFSSVSYYIHGDNKLQSPSTTPDAILVQKLLAKMMHNGTEAVVMEASSHGLALGRCNEVDFDIAVFTNLTRDRYDFEGSEEEYRDAKVKLFSRMVDPERHRKIVNIDDPNAASFIAQGNPDVPVVTYAVENKDADVHSLKFELSLFETQVLVKTPDGLLEISSGLLGRHNIYNILAAVAVGIAVGAPLEDIVRGIEEVDAVPGRCELIDEGQAFGVIVDYARTPDALSRLLDFVRELGPKRIITVIGCPGESERGKRPMMTKIATDKSDVTIVTSDNPKNEDPCLHILWKATFSPPPFGVDSDSILVWRIDSSAMVHNSHILFGTSWLSASACTFACRVDILDDMLAGVGWTMQDYLNYGQNDYYPPLKNGHRLFLHDIREVAVRAAVAMGEEGDMVVIAGKGHETIQIEGNDKDFFDDREECRDALQNVDELHKAGVDTSEFPWRIPESH